jgi:hypothetical protein
MESRVTCCACCGDPFAGPPVEGRYCGTFCIAAVLTRQLGARTGKKPRPAHPRSDRGRRPSGDRGASG